MVLTKCGNWPRAGIVKAWYQDSYVASPLVARLLIDTMSQVFSQSGAQDAALIVETRLPRSNDQRGQPWQIAHDWRGAADQRAVIELFGKQRGVCVSVLHKNVPHGRYLSFEFKDGSHATIVLDQGFGAWAPPRQVSVPYNFAADTAAQSKRLATINAVLQRRGISKTYFVATSTYSRLLKSGSVLRARAGSNERVAVFPTSTLMRGFPEHHPCGTMRELVNASLAALDGAFACGESSPDRAEMSTLEQARSPTTFSYILRTKRHRSGNSVIGAKVLAIRVAGGRVR